VAVDSVDNSQTTASGPHCPQPYYCGLVEPADRSRRITINTGQHGTTFGVKPVEEEVSFGIDSVELYNDEIYISIKRKRRSRLKNGDRLVVVTPDEGGRNEMGLFEICKLQPQNGAIRAKALRLDPLWEGLIRSRGEGRYSPPPLSIAILIPWEEMQ
jgi:hypothetical protein